MGAVFPGMKPDCRAEEEGRSLARRPCAGPLWAVTAGHSPEAAFPTTDIRGVEAGAGELTRCGGAWEVPGPR